MLRVLFGFIVLVLCIALFTLVRNDANLMDPPGPLKRLAVFLSANSASTMDDHPFEELRTPIFDLDAESMYQQVLNSANELSWGIIAHDSDRLNANFVVRSPMLLFEDDVYVQVRPVNEKQSSLYIQSNSRSESAHADFAANSGHIQELITKLKEDLE
jgi:hypothetical protein